MTLFWKFEDTDTNNQHTQEYGTPSAQQVCQQFPYKWEEIWLFLVDRRWGELLAWCAQSPHWRSCFFGLPPTLGVLLLSHNEQLLSLWASHGAITVWGLYSFPHIFFPTLSLLVCVINNIVTGVTVWFWMGCLWIISNIYSEHLKEIIVSVRARKCPTLRAFPGFKARSTNSTMLGECN